MIGEFETVRDLLADESRWCQRAIAVDEAGHQVACHSEKAVRFCLLGACRRVYGTEDAIWQSRKKICEALGLTDMSSLGLGLARFNDTHSHAEVLDLVTKAGV
jgi:hypothetical protein